MMKKLISLIPFFASVLLFHVEAQNIEIIGDTIEIAIQDYKAGQIQFQFSTDKKDWQDIVLTDKVKVNYCFKESGFFRAMIFNTNCVYYSDTIFIKSEKDVQLEKEKSDLYSYLNFLTSSEAGGRLTGSISSNLVINYIIEQINNGIVQPITENWIQKYKSPSNYYVNNILGYLKGTDPVLSNDFVLLCAHFDALGKNANGEILNGADDNGSGTALLLNLVKYFSKNYNGKRSLLFVFFDSEEVNISRGSKYFTNNPPISLNQIKAVINFDTIGRLDKSKDLYIYGCGSSNTFNKTINDIETKLNINTKQEMIPGKVIADHLSFYERGIPSLWLFTGMHNDIHKVTDDIGKINFDGLIEISEFSKDLILRFTNVTEFKFQNVNPYSDNFMPFTYN